jgi:uncharacterized protein (DUF885 family)
MVNVRWLCVFLVLATGCSSSSSKLERLAGTFVNTTLAFSPSSATAAGLHTFQGKPLDELLDDFSPANLDRQRRFYVKTRAELEQLSPEKLTPGERADLKILLDQIGLALMDLDDFQTAFHNPTLYVETLGNALFTPFVQEYAPKPERMRHIIARLSKVPLYLDQARTNLAGSPAVWTQVASEENQGNLNLVDQVIRAQVPADQKDAYAGAARPAIEAMKKFDDFLKARLAGREGADWRAGGGRYPRKFRFAMDVGVEADTVLQQAERDLQTVRARMLEVALPLHRSIAAAHGDHDDLAGAERENRLIGEVLDHIAERRSTAETFLPDARRTLDEARAFVASKNLLTLPQSGNLQVIETPEFMRGSYPVGGFNPAPALEPKLGAYYWVTPIPKDWKPERVDSKLREYNFYKLKLLTIHEAMPGHYVQFEFANAVEPAPRRLLRAVFGNGPYVEGWAQFATQTMLDEGFLNHSPELQLTFMKEELRVIANAIIDIRLHMLNMSDEEALSLMQTQTFQELEEATAKLQRAKLTSCQLPMYYTGWRAWVRLRDDYKRAKGSAFNVTAFNDLVLQQGAVPLPTLRTLLP